MRLKLQADARILGATITGLLQFFSPPILNNYLFILGQACYFHFISGFK